MKYKDFIAKAAIEIMAHQCTNFTDDMFADTDKEGNYQEPSYAVTWAAIHSINAAMTLADELAESFDDLETDNNQKMGKHEQFFDSYEVTP